MVLFVQLQTQTTITTDCYKDQLIFIITTAAALAMSIGRASRQGPNRAPAAANH